MKYSRQTYQLAPKCYSMSISDRKQATVIVEAFAVKRISSVPNRRQSTDEPATQSILHWRTYIGVQPRKSQDLVFEYDSEVD